MKKFLIFIAIGIGLMASLSSCFHFHRHDISISINDDEDEYRLYAKYDDRKTRAVENYIKHCTETDGNFNFGSHGNMEGNLILDDNSKFYIKSREGYLKINFNKEQNSPESYERLKDMCEGIKELLAKN